MASRYVSILESLRPMQQTGFSYIYDEAGLLQQSLEDVLRESLRAEQERNRNKGFSYSQSSFMPNETKNTLLQDRRLSPASHGVSPRVLQERASASLEVDPSLGAKATLSLSSHQVAAASALSASSLSAFSSPASSPVVDSPKQIFSFPPEWQDMLDKTRSAPIIWTYKDLWGDLHGQDSQNRGDTIRRLISALQLPKGSNSFFPCCKQVDAATFEQAPDVFFHSLKKLQSKVIFLFGEESLPFLKPHVELKTVFTQSLFEGRLFISLPSLALLEDIDLFTRVLSFLRAHLGQFTFLQRQGGV